MNKLFFFHCPKAGGTSVTASLASRYEPSAIAPNIENDVAGHKRNDGRYEQYRGFDFYSGHYGVDIFNAVANGHRCLTNFRHPVSRIYSLYRFFREVEVAEADLTQRHYAAVRVARSSSFADFAASDDVIVLTYISNQQTRQLTGSPWATQAAMDLDAALKMVERMTWFYVCEQPAESLAWLKNALDIDEIPVLNVTGKRAAPDEVLAAAPTILDRNRLDLALYEYALARLGKCQNASRPTSSGSRV